MRHIHTSIVSRHLATRGNNKILRTPPPHTSSSEEIPPRLTRRTLAQLRTNKSPFLKSYLHKVDAKTHPSPLCPLCNIHTHDTRHLFNCTHIRTTLSPLDLWTDPAGVTALLAREAGWWTTSGNIGLPPHQQGPWEWVDNTQIFPMKDLPLGGSTTCRRELLEPIRQQSSIILYGCGSACPYICSPPRIY